MKTKKNIFNVNVLTDFSSFCQNIREVKVFYIGGEREIRQEIAAGIYLVCWMEIGSSWSAQFKSRMEKV